MRSLKFRILLKLIGTTIVLLTVQSLSHSQTNVAPPARHLSHMVYDEGNSQILLYGGSTGNYSYNDLWAFGSSGWKKLFEGGPTERIKAAFTYDTHRKKAVLFGGSGANNKLLDDTWEWDGKAWKQIMTTGPLNRNHALAAYDKKNKVVVMFGGVGPNGLLSDTWLFDGSSWKQADSNGPKDCLPHGMIYNETAEKIMLVTLSVTRDPKDEAHAINSIWEWTGKSWTKLPEATSFMSSSNLQALSIFKNDAIVLFDGSDVTNNKCKTWTFTQSRWESQILDGPSNRFGHAMAFDKKKGKTFLFGGFGNGKLLNDLWCWDGRTWTAVK
jgi:hypothetical protein